MSGENQTVDWESIKIKGRESNRNKRILWLRVHFNSDKLINKRIEAGVMKTCYMNLVERMGKLM